MELPYDDEEEQLRSVAIQNAQSILLARNRAEHDLVAAKEALELRTAELERANALVRTITENAASCLLMLDERGVTTYMIRPRLRTPDTRWRSCRPPRSTIFFTRRRSVRATPSAHAPSRTPASGWCR